MRKFIIIIIQFGMVFFASFAHAFYFDGGNGDGFASSPLGYSRSWGFWGGHGRGEAMTLTASQTLMTFTSAANQSFLVGASATAASTITIRQDSTVGSGVLSGGNLYVTIPANVPMVWNTARLTAAVTGNISNNVTYANDGKTLVLTATANFSDGDSVTVAGLEFQNFTLTGYGNLLLDITGGLGASDPDLMQKMINIGERSNGFLGGAGRGETVLDIYQHPGNSIDFGILF